MTAYIYLHGFASSPQSSKAQYLRDRFTDKNLYLKILDLNQGNFSSLTLTRQIQQTIAAIDTPQTSVTLIGSSFGGLTAAWVAQQQPQVNNLILLAPAFGFPDSWQERLSPHQIQQWQESGFLPIYHYGAGREIPLHYEFCQDAANYPLSGLKRSLNTLIIHGINDDVVPIQVSRDYANQHSLVRLIELDSDHGLNDVHDQIWNLIQDFLNLGEAN
ncbi:MAG: YqiA/YcfP family alpha/beta fold hydrolase [Cyanobacteria bacterium P01_A01_bin.83]